MSSHYRCVILEKLGETFKSTEHEYTTTEYLYSVGSRLREKMVDLCEVYLLVGTSTHVTGSKVQCSRIFRYAGVQGM